jgi:cell division protein DivIC
MQSSYKAEQSNPFKNNKNLPDPEVEKSKKKKRRRLKLLSLVMVAFLVWAGSLWLDQREVLQTKMEELEAVKLKVQEANESQIELSYQIKRLHDKDYIAEVARRDYFLSRPGEMIFKVPEK